MITDVKRSKIQISRLDTSLEAKLNAMSSKVYEVYSKSVVDGGISKKKDSAPVPIELWLYDLFFFGRRMEEAYSNTSREVRFVTVAVKCDAKFRSLDKREG